MVFFWFGQRSAWVQEIRKSAFERPERTQQAIAQVRGEWGGWFGCLGVRREFFFFFFLFFFLGFSSEWGGFFLDF